MRLGGLLAILILALGACASPAIVDVNAPVSVHQVRDFRMDHEDAIVPVRITHNSEQIWNRETLEQHYNYLVYEFETEEHRYGARSYLDEIHTVAIFGPFKKDDESDTPLESVEIDPRVISYLSRRYSEITRFTSAGYETMEHIDRAE